MLDPWHDVLERDSAYYEYEQSLPTCDECGEKIHDDYYYDINGEILCEDCLKKYRRTTEC